MSKGKHTPGPWSFRPFGGTDAELDELRQMGLKPLRMILNTGAVAVTSKHSRICEVDCQTAFKRGAGHLAECEERDANARLIAAAPELLDVLKAFPGFIADVTIGDDWIEKALAAIAKAEGRT